MMQIFAVLFHLFLLAAGCTVYDDVKDCSATDLNSNGVIEPHEYAQFTALRNAFQFLDADNSGTITNDECISRGRIPTCLHLHGMTYLEYLEARRSFYREPEWNKRDKDVYTL